VSGRQRPAHCGENDSLKEIVRSLDKRLEKSHYSESMVERRDQSLANHRSTQELHLDDRV